jgi:hypothetical protein
MVMRAQSLSGGRSARQIEAGARRLTVSIRSAGKNQLSARKAAPFVLYRQDDTEATLTLADF